MDHFNQTGNILLTEDGKVQHPINVDLFLIVTKCITSVIGIPLNLLVAIIIIRLRRFHSKPRHIFLLGIIFSDLFIYVPVLIEFVYWNSPVNYVCEAYVAVVGLPYSILLLNMLILALSDRYIAIKNPLWHRKRVTVRFAVICLLLSSASSVFIMKFVYIFGFAPIRCEIWFDHGRVVGLTTVLLFVLCTIANFIVYRQTKTLLQKSRTVKPEINDIGLRTFIQNQETTDVESQAASQIYVGNNTNRTPALIEVQTIGNKTWNATDSNVDTSASMAIHVDSKTLHKMEMEATRTLITSVTSLFAMALPPVLLFLTVYFCRLIGTFQCSRVSWVAPYFKIFGLIHSSINPLIWLLRNDEFRLVLTLKIDQTSRNWII